MLEKGSDLGGVWHWNRSPGLTGDVPSQHYQFAFAPKPDWERIWASGPADFVVCANGVLENPSIPNIPGLDTFGGPVVHTARWDDDLDLTDRRVAVIGTGSTGVQDR